MNVSGTDKKLREADEKIRLLEKELTETNEGVLALTIELEQKNVILTELNKELEAFSYSVSHDLRAPLRHIIGFIDLLKKSSIANLDETSQRYMNTISDSAMKMQTLIDDLLSFSRLGRAEMKKLTVNLNRVVKEVIQELQEETKGRDINWKVSKLPEVIGDQSLLRLVLVNLISNAIKFTGKQAKPEIEIGHFKQNPSSLSYDKGARKHTIDEEVFYVKDNGIGFDMKYVNKLFGVFQRLHSEKDFEGTGIGLANVKRIITRHGGRVWAEGKVDEGATFFFSLPKKTTEEG